MTHIIDPDQLQADVSINDADLDSAMIQQASLAAYYGAMAARATREASKAKLRIETSESFVYGKLRKQHLDACEKVTEAMLKNEVATHSDVIKAHAAYFEAQEVADLGKVAFEAFKQRRDMLVQTSKNRMEERRGKLMMTGDSADVEAKKEEVMEVIKANAAGAAAA